jgi:hypothetical protein
MSNTFDVQTHPHGLGYKQRIEDQQTRIASSNHYQDLFYEPYCNNFSIICLNRRFGKDLFYENKKNSLYKLNRAVYNLWVFTGMCLEKMKEMDEFRASKELLDKISETSREWGAHLKTGNAFLTYDFAAEVIDAIRLLNFPFDDLLGNETYSVIKKAFTNLHFQEKGCVRIGLFANGQEVYAALQQLTDMMFEHPLVFYYVERFEIAQETFPQRHGKEPSAEEYPALSVFLDSSIVTTHHHPLVGEVLSMMTPVVSGLSPLNPDTEYAFLAEANLTLSQGLRNYKRYLSLLGIIDEVYDRELNYAFIKNRI